MLKKEEHEEVLSNILKNVKDESVGEVTQILQKLREEYEIDVNQFNTQNNTLEELNKTNEKLRNFNMELYSKIPINSEVKKEEKQKEEEKKIVEEEKKNFDSLIDTLGGFK